jgi:hypothetical protein
LAESSNDKEDDQDDEDSSSPRIQRDPSGEEPDDDTTTNTANQSKKHNNNNSSSSSFYNNNNQEPMGQPSTKYGLQLEDDDDDDDDSRNYGGALPPPLLPPANGDLTPPSYQAVVAERHNRYKNNLLWGPAANGSLSSSSVSYPIPPPPSPPRTRQHQPAAAAAAQQQQKQLPLTQLQVLHEQDYNRYQRMGRIRVIPLDTYQGRVNESTNGCTVISALVAATHLRAAANGSGGGVTNAQITAVIDRQCGPLLRQIRSKLGLGGHALIIPSDVHDHLVDQKLLQQEQFVGAAGGNILDADHLGQFLQLVAEASGTTATTGRNGETTSNSPNLPTAATLFFREHVVSLVKQVAGSSSSSTHATATYSV